MKQQRPSIGPVELEILRYVSERHPVTVRQVADHMAAARGLARTTVLTMMERLRTKGFLNRREANGVNTYWPEVGKPQLLRQLIGDFVQQALGGSVSPLVAYLAEAPDLTSDEIDELRRIVEELKRRESKRRA